MRDIVGAKGGTASGAPTTSCPDGPSSLPGGGKMPDQVSSYVCKAFEVIKSRAGDKPDKIFDVLYRKKLQYFGYF